MSDALSILSYSATFAIMSIAGFVLMEAIAKLKILYRKNDFLI